MMPSQQLAPRSPSCAILVVDDRREDLMAIEHVLGDTDYQVVCAASGSQALRCVLERDFAVILLDVMMPDVDGIEVARVIKRRERSRHTPILFLTAAGTDVGLLYRGYSVGAVDYLVKPIDPDVLRAKVSTFVELYRKDERIREQAAALRDADRREREREMAAMQLASERRYRNLAEAIPQIVWTAKPDGAVTYFNARWLEYTGQPFREARGWGWAAALHPLDVERWRLAFADAVATQDVFELECRVRGRDGHYRWHLCRAVPEADPGGEPVGWLGTCTDFDDRKRAYDAAEDAIAARDEFLSIASHELRTPLSTLRLRLQSLAVGAQGTAPPGDQALHRRIESALRQISRLASLVDGLLDVGRITSGHLALSPEPFDLAEAAREVLERFSEAAAAAGCDLELRAAGPAPGTWDRMRIEQVLQNLVTNALTYAPRAPIEVTTEVRGEVAVLTVRDHGPGISPADVERIFGRFERAVPASQYGGLGLGLYIAHQVVVAHGGSIKVDRASPGAVFTIELPRA